MSEAIEISRAVEADFARVTEIITGAYLHAGYFDSPDHHYLDVVRKVEERAQHAEIYVARRAGQTIATMTLVQHGSQYADVAREGELEIRMLSVDPAVQRSGAGQALVHAAIDRARQLPGVQAVSLTTGGHWHGARRLYEKLGFSHVAERDFPIPDTDVVLVVYVLELEKA